MEMELQGTAKNPKKGTVAKPKKVKEPVLKIETPKYYTYEDYPYEDLLTYAGIDCIVTSELLSKLSSKVFEKPEYTFIDHGKSSKAQLMSIAESYGKYTTEAHDFILDLEVNGIKYDVELNARVKARLEAEIRELEDGIFEYIPRDINLDSGVDIGAYLYDTLQLETERKTKTGENSTDGDTMKELANSYPEHRVWLELLAKRNDLNSIYNTFVKDYVKDFVKSDGRIHANYSLHGTGSFRIAGDNPNLTQLPRPKHGYNLRTLFTVEPGNVFMAFDFSSAEVKILGALCKDPALLQAIANGQDFHSLSASKMYGIDYDEFVNILGNKQHPLAKEFKEKRQSSKALTFGILKLLRL